MYPSDIRKKLATGKPVLSTSMPSFEPHIANATYNCKPDWVWIDTEHNPWGTESMGTLCVDGRKKGDKYGPVDKAGYMNLLNGGWIEDEHNLVKTKKQKKEIDRVVV